MSIGTRIRAARQGAGMTQEDFARAIGVTVVTPSRWERGANRPLARQLTVISDVTGVPVETLTQDDEDNEAIKLRAAEILAAEMFSVFSRAISEKRSTWDGVDRRHSDRVHA